MKNIEDNTDDEHLALSTKPVFPLWAKNKINGLKNLQIKITNVESKYFEEIKDLERKYKKIFDPLYDERMKIITGEKEKLSEEETRWNYEEGNTYQDMNNDEDVSSASKKNVPDFWLEAFRSSRLLSSLVQEHDEKIFKHLKDIRCRIHEQKPYGYTIEFHFSENEYFTNKVLTKTYELICDKDEQRPFLLANGHFYKCKGCIIDWKEGKDLSIQIIKSKEEDKKSNLNRCVTKEEQQDTFFTFFVTPNEDGIKPSIKALLKKSKGGNCDEKNINEDNEGGEDEAAMNHDLDTIFDLYIEIGQYMKDTFLPKAILYYIGEINEFTDEDFADDLEDYDEDEDSDNNDEDSDDDDEEDNGNEQDDEVHQNAPRKKIKPQ